MRGHSGGRRAQSYLPYIIIAVILYVAYTLVASMFRRPPSLPMNVVQGGGGMPVIDMDAQGGVAAVLPVAPDEVRLLPKPEIPVNEDVHLSAEQKKYLKSILPTMQRIVHLDLKGAAPKVSYLANLFPLMKKLGATGLLIEWEDMFPYSGKIVNISAENCYTKEEVKEIVGLAKANDLMVIPLIQTFGHMEFVLKIQEFKHLREETGNPQVINPFKKGSLPLIEEMIDQQMALLPDVEHMHIGCDEVWALGNSVESKAQMESLGMTKSMIFLNHVREVAGIVKNKYPLVEVLMWDDMFRNAEISHIVRAQISKLITPMVWVYTNCIECKIPLSVWLKYSKIFSTIWIASAFKGATGSDQQITEVGYHYKNHLSWLNLISSSDFIGALHVEGIALTGWQRYDHFATLCELLPSGIPSLGVNLAAMQQAAIGPDQLVEVNKVLGCAAHDPIQWNINKNNAPGPACTFPGHEVLEAVYELKNGVFFMNFLDAPQGLKGWHTDYNMKRYFTSPWKMNYLRTKCDQALTKIETAERTMKLQLPLLFSEETAIEWQETFIDPKKNLLLATKQKVEDALKHDSWPRRPIHKHQNKNGEKVDLPHS